MLVLSFSHFDPERASIRQHQVKAIMLPLPDAACSLRFKPATIRGLDSRISANQHTKTRKAVAMNPILTLSNSPEPEVAQIIRDGLDAFNDAIVGYGDRVPLHVLVRASEDGEIIGGISGGTSLGLLTINLVYLPETLRGTGVGTRMMAMAEQEARRRGCRAGVIYTISFQAPGFYQRLGWRGFGEIPCDPPGTSRVFLRKDFR